MFLSLNGVKLSHPKRMETRMIARKTEFPPCEKPVALAISQNERIAAAWQFAFSQQGFCLIHEQTPRHALQAARLLLPELTILDLDLTKAQRLELCRQLRPLTRKALLLLAPSASKDDMAKYYRAGVDERLSPLVSPLTLLGKSLAWVAQTSS